MNSFIDPSSLSLPSPPSPSPDPASPSDTSLAAGPSRKRARTEATPEDRKEARAHRNRVAAQNSRDRRKAQFTFLERRVAELEEENRLLRAGVGMLDHRNSGQRMTGDLERERARERENEELRERIKTLEKGWDTVVKALAGQGLPVGIPTPPTSTATSTATSPNNDTSPPPPTAFPILVPTPAVVPISPALTSTSLSSAHLFSEEFEFESTRHLARVATNEAPPPSMSLQRITLDLGPSPQTSHHPTPTPTPTSPAVDDTTMEDLFREILAPSPSLPPAPLPMDPQALLRKIATPSVAPAAPALTSADPHGGLVDWASEVEMQRILDMLPSIHSDVVGADAGGDYPLALDLELGAGWEYEGVSMASLNEIGVF